MPLYANWNQIFDGIYYIEKMYPPVYKAYDSEEDKSSLLNKPTSISGTVLDAVTSNPIAYADIYFTDITHSTVSNTKGKFLISNTKDQDSYLMFSAVGYESDSIQIREFEKSKSVFLTKSKDDIVLNEVVVTAKLKTLSPEEIIKKARKNIEANYVQTPYNQSFLFKIKESQLKDTLEYGEEALIQTYNQKGINGSNNPETSFFGEIKNLRNNTDKYEKNKYTNGIGSLWVVLNRDVILSKTNVLYRTSSYDLTSKDILNYDGRKVYQIEFKNNSPGSYSTGYGYPAPENSQGSIFIDMENYAVLKYEHCIQRAPYKPKKSENTVKNWHNIVQSYKNVNGTYFINLLEVSNMVEVYTPDDVHINTYVKVEQLVSNTIETQNVKVLKRPLTHLKKGYKKNTEDTYWNDKPMDFKITIPDTVLCWE